MTKKKFSALKCSYDIYEFDSGHKLDLLTSKIIIGPDNLLFILSFFSIPRDISVENAVSY